MSNDLNESINDSQNILKQDDHMNGMERTKLHVLAIDRPFPSVIRVTAKINPSDVNAWLRANLAIRIEVATPPNVRPVSRVYTVRSFDPSQNIMEVDLVAHEDDSPAMRWLNNLEVGSESYFTGPRGHFIPNYDKPAPIAIFADETAIPAVYSILQHWPDNASADVFIETCDQAAFAELPHHPKVNLHWLARHVAQPAGSTKNLLKAAQTYAQAKHCTVWAAGERQEMREMRNFFVEECGLSRDDVRVFGYWRSGVSSSAIDRKRFEYYQTLLEKGEGLNEYSDDLSIAI